MGAGTTPNIGSFDTDRLGSWLAENVPGYEGPLEIEKFQGGQSIPTYKLAAASGAYVLRRKPSGDLLPSAHAVDREFRILSALAGGPVPVARVYGLCLDEKIIGTAFYVMAYVFGRVYWDPRLPGLSKSWRQGIFNSMNATIASLHSLDPAALGLANFGRPGNFMARQIARWSKQYRASEMESIPAMDNLIAWLPDRIPPDHEHRIVHGDYRLDNVIVDADAPQIAAVLDWELATLGDPLADFAYHVSTWRIAPELFRGLADIDFEGLGIPREFGLRRRILSANETLERGRLGLLHRLLHVSDGCHSSRHRETCPRRLSRGPDGAGGGTQGTAARGTSLVHRTGLSEVDRNDRIIGPRASNERLARHSSGGIPIAGAAATGPPP